MNGRFGGIGRMKPERMAREFIVFAPESQASSSGRERMAQGAEIGRVRCVLSRAKMEERERYRQMRVEMSHVLLARGAPAAYAGCTLAMAENERRFRVRAVRDIGGVGAFCAYDCEELL